MCRWMAWHGQPVLLEELLFKPRHGLVDQSLHSRLGAETTNGDGFGLGWYGTGEGPGIYRSIAPAWGDANLRELAASHRVAAVSRARAGDAPARRCRRATATRSATALAVRAQRPDQRVRSGAPRADARPRRPLCSPTIQGSTDSEVIFHLALTFGLEDDPIARARARRSDSSRTRRSRTGSRRPSRRASASATASACGRCAIPARALADAVPLRRRRAVTRLYPENPRVQRLKRGDRIVVSEPIADLPGAWHEIPESSAIAIAATGAWEMRPFEPRAPAASA